MKKPDQLFAHHNIDTAKPGFYDDPAFLAAEKEDSLFLENYARHIATRTFSAEYLARASVEIPLIASICHQELVADGRLGACIDIGMFLARILEQEGLWSYQVKGSLTVQFPPTSGIGRRYFWSYDLRHQGQPSFDAAHAWIVAPPYSVVDVAIKRQPYDKGEDLLPDVVISDSNTKVKAAIGDIFSPPLIEFARANGIAQHQLLQVFAPKRLPFIRDFPAIEVIAGEMRFVYIPLAVTAPDLPFETLDALRFNGRLAIEIYNDLVVPALCTHRRNTG